MSQAAKAMGKPQAAEAGGDGDHGNGWDGPMKGIRAGTPGIGVQVGLPDAAEYHVSSESTLISSANGLADRNSAAAGAEAPTVSRFLAGVRTLSASAEVGMSGLAHMLLDAGAR